MWWKGEPAAETAAAAAAAAAASSSSSSSRWLGERRLPSMFRRRASEEITPSLEASSSTSSLFSGPKEVCGYRLVEVIGAGAFATVEKCVREADGAVCAVKVFEKAVLRKRRNMLPRGGGNKQQVQSALDKVHQELQVMKKLMCNHPNLVKLLDSFDDVENDRIYMFMEFVARGPVMKWDEQERVYACRITGGACGPHRAGRYIYDIANGLQFLHENHIAHRDLKPDNILLSADERCKISDFGVARHFAELDGDVAHATLSRSSRQIKAAALQKSESRAQVQCTEGTYAYWAPEMLQETMFNAMACDVWALGVCFFNFLTRRLPFDDDALDAIFDQIKEGPVDFPEDETGEVPVLRSLLERDVKQRATLRDIFNNQWIKDVSKDLVRKDRMRELSRQSRLSTEIIARVSEVEGRIFYSTS
ncbi:hypothetical protein CTAYLR_008917 [Chrysophaeum taylorii]|uniref:Protein kinase domain-containing protein n=1 Tax=Chrysophaeum taylorii TaxID=2483200 RepID=A0AAD7XKG3_9STRA|nr:hypothetical protein CTAYLR_008917 [Chrysophaeum taylorii]